ncbi:hypothetical protein RirG_260080 [Rhizophagus irregularis DAOM 197198w]|uniref:Uncharacterized protein n=1 Tax=Rhizophagus irregularis (strain DAOM 197198w) TaxID=1432141 RepID=A0A015I3W9_RHIIW|nr:hypothetical protein RirG_260080 [Rhizophagus irregularis DAOM 197198w]
MQAFTRQSYLLNGGSKILNFQIQLMKRSFTSTNIARDAAAQESSSSSTKIGTSVQPTRKPIGGVLGLTIAGGAGYHYLLDEYNTASKLLLSSVEELQKSTNKVRDYTRKIERVELELKALQMSAATIDQIKELRGEVRQLYVIKILILNIFYLFKLNYLFISLLSRD